jgi:hypothetical protein
MKKALSFLLLAGIVTALYFSGHQSNQTKESVYQKLFSAKEASVSRVALTDSIARSSSQTFLFLYTVPRSNASMIVLNSLPKTVDEFDSILPHLRHGNVSLVEFGGQKYGLVPQYMLPGTDLAEMLELGGFRVKLMEDRNVVQFGFKNENQRAFSPEVFDRIQPDLLNGKSCTIRTLNCYRGETIPYQFTMSGPLNYLTPQEKAVIESSKNDSGTKLGSFVKSKGLYLVRIPERYAKEAFGMSGGMVTATIDGKEYLVGLTVNPLQLEAADGVTHASATFLCVQPIVASDFQ